MKIKVTVEGKYGQTWKVLESATASVGDSIPIKWTLKGPFGIKITLVGRIRVEQV